jgi:hypothetical protein
VLGVRVLRKAVEDFGFEMAGEEGSTSLLRPLYFEVRSGEWRKVLYRYCDRGFGAGDGAVERVALDGIASGGADQAF